MIIILQKTQLLLSIWIIWSERDRSARCYCWWRSNLFNYQISVWNSSNYLSFELTHDLTGESTEVQWYAATVRCENLVLGVEAIEGNKGKMMRVPFKQLVYRSCSLDICPDWVSFLEPASSKYTVGPLVNNSVTADVRRSLLFDWSEDFFIFFQWRSSP